MDDSPIQTVLCVLGHPIGGNPTQFAVQRALLAMNLDWQILSFDVAPEAMKQAVEGLDALGFAGAMIGSPYETKVDALLRSTVQSQAVESPCDPTTGDPAAWSDCLCREKNHAWKSLNLYATAIFQLVGPTATETFSWLLLGELSDLPNRLLPLASRLPKTIQVISGNQIVAWPIKANTVATSSDASSPATPEGSTTPQEAALDCEQNVETESPRLIIWAMTGKPSKKISKTATTIPSQAFVNEVVEALPVDSILIDLTQTATRWIAASSLQRMRVVSPIEIEIKRLSLAIECWTGKSAQADIVREALEEYLEL